MGKQRDAFLDGEGDSYFGRNESTKLHADPVLDGLLHLAFKPHAVAEVGTGSGERLALISDHFPDSACVGFDPSSLAITSAASRYPRNRFAVGTADRIDLADSSVDLLIFGFCLYLTDPSDHFRIASEADRVLQDRGFVCVFDFLPRASYRNAYTHKSGLYSHKMEFSRMLSWHPSYRLLHRINGEARRGHTREEDETWACDFLLKDTVGAFPKRA